MGEKRETKTPRPDDGGADTWSLPAERLREILSGTEEARREGYAEMIDRYHDIFDFLKELEAGGMSGRIEVDRMRDRLHKQLLKVGETLGKDAADVQADLLRREGNLAEYGLPEYGIISHEDVSEDKFNAYSFGGLEVNKSKGTFSRQISARELFKQHREHAGWRAKWLKKEATIIDAARVEAEERGAVKELDKDQFIEQYGEKTLDVPDVGTVDAVFGLKPGEVAIIFGLTFTVDIDYDACPIMPADYTERLRRAARAAKECNGTLFQYTIGAYHDTTTLIGVAVPAERLEAVARLLREKREVFGVRKGDMDPRVVETDRRTEIEHMRTSFVSVFDKTPPRKSGRFEDEEDEEETEDEEDAAFFQIYLKKRKKFFGEDPNQF